MLNLIMDLTARCPRDSFFTANPELMRELAASVPAAVQDLGPMKQALVLGQERDLPNAELAGFERMVDSGPTLAMQPHEDWRAILAFAREQAELERGNVLYVNPLQGVVCAKRIAHLFQGLGQDQALVSASRVPANAHPLWATPVPLKLRHKDKLVLKRSQVLGTLRDDQELTRILQGGQDTEITGSQHLAGIYVVDAAVIAVPDALYFSADPKDFAADIVTWDQAQEEDIPWMYHVPVFNMARDTKTGARPQGRS